MVICCVLSVALGGLVVHVGHRFNAWWQDEKAHRRVQADLFSIAEHAREVNRITSETIPMSPREPDKYVA